MVINIGFGCGIIDAAIDGLPTPPLRHIIVEAHPDVLTRLGEAGWPQRPHVTVLGGRWQDQLKLLAADSVDAIFYDTCVRVRVILSR